MQVFRYQALLAAVAAASGSSSSSGSLSSSLFSLLEVTMKFRWMNSTSALAVFASTPATADVISATWREDYNEVRTR